MLAAAADRLSAVSAKELEFCPLGACLSISHEAPKIGTSFAP